ncbi:FecR family protein [Chryseobacterium populi]|uniref:Fe2+-dicitrate sensor, membrane component n=1 Tax=Chryseobacterium populi TaxID=1144316 RepID=J2TB26_9FLAO|nr:FecR family protein [Chryseobacterium populi]EJL75357.1 Fe2+-dicitrate sensor, membrane component [Chryseobacterium populi]
MSLEEEFEKNWKSASEEQNRIDGITDAKIWVGIEKKIEKKKSVRKIYWAAAVLVPFFVLFALFKIATQVSETGIEKKYVYETLEKGKSFKLPDGSNVELKPYSKLTLNRNFGEKTRDMIFTGQGKFSVAKDKTKPFRINAGEFNVQVLGTQFFLDQKSAEKKVELFEGKVKIEHGSTITYLLPKEIWINDEHKKDYHYYHPEKPRDFTFDHSAYSEAIQELENVYNIKISYPARFKNKKVSGAFKGNLKEVLSVISFPFNLKPERINEREIILK